MKESISNEKKLTTYIMTQYRFAPAQASRDMLPLRSVQLNSDATQRETPDKLPTRRLLVQGLLVTARTMYPLSGLLQFCFDLITSSAPNHEGNYPLQSHLLDQQLYHTSRSMDVQQRQKVQQTTKETERETSNQTILMQYALSPGPTFERTTSPRPQLPVYSSDRFFATRSFIVHNTTLYYCLKRTYVKNNLF
jgi:hypothetical protein